MTLSLCEWYYNGIYYISLEFSYSLLYHITEGSELYLILLGDKIIYDTVQFNSVQLLCHVQLFVTPGTAAYRAFLFITFSQSLLKIMSIASVMSSNNLILCHPLLLLPSIFPQMRFSISTSNEYSGLISFKIDWLDLLAAVQRTLKGLLQNHSSKASILWQSVFFIVQLSHPYMTTGKNIAFD